MIYTNKDWSDISIEKFYAIHELLSRTEDSMEVALEVLNLVYGKDYETVPLCEYFKALKTLKFMNTDIVAKSPKKHYKLGKNRYEVIGDITEMSADDYLRLSKALKRIDGRSVHTIASCFLKPLKSGSDERESDCLKYMSVVDALSLRSIMDKSVKNAMDKGFGLYVLTILKTDGVSWKKKLSLIKQFYNIFSYGNKNNK